MLRKPLFWIVLALLSLGGIAFAVHFFGEAFPLVELDIRMDRSAALAAARDLAKSQGVGPADYRQAASFDLDEDVQSFVELEAGGREAFGAMLRGTLYSPYTWRVRHFRPGETNETELRFTPDGKPFAYSEQLSESAPGPKLDAAAARGLAETAARGWGIELTAHELVEQGSEERPGGRVDHTLVWERRDPRVGAGSYRVRVTVSGDRVTGIAPFVRIPEAFNRRYANMRSSNEAIAAAAAIAMAVLYLLGGCVVGLFFLLRQRWVIWRAPILWSGVIAGLQLLNGFNELPLRWMNYDTAVAVPRFLVQQLLQVVAGSILMWGLLAISFMAAESLGRRAFPHHLQMWRLWRGELASSPPVLGFTVAGYLLVGLFFAYDVALYLVATRLDPSWWSPSSALYDPNVIATYLPWLQAIAVSAQAGFWEECLFRAVPLACGALLGERFGGRRGRLVGIVLALVLQALVFGAGHANYPMQPAYARVIELIVPSLGFAGLYLAFGLLPGIVLHFVFDVVWFAMPLFIASSPGIRVSQALVIALTLVPLFVVLTARWRLGRRGTVAAADFNGAWVPAPAEAVVEEVPSSDEGATVGPRRWVPAAVLAAGAAGLVAWGSFALQVRAPSLQVERRAAEERALAELTAQGFSAVSPWRVLPEAVADVETPHRFVWRETDPKTFDALVGSYLRPPRWIVRVARFEGDVAEREEEIWVGVWPDGEVRRVRHQLPDARPGAQLDLAAARSLAATALRERLGVDAATVREISAVPTKRPARTDWEFTFRDPAPPAVADGEKRLVVEIAGDAVVDAQRLVHVPEAWERADRDRESTSGIVRIVSMSTVAVVFLAGVGAAVVAWSRRRFAARRFAAAAITIFVTGVVAAANGWPQVLARLDTAWPLRLQVTMGAAFALVGLAVMALAVGLVAGLVHRWAALLPAATPLAAGSRSRGATVWLVGAALAATVSGLAATAAAIGPQPDPPWPDVEAATSYVPVLEVALSPVSSLFVGGSLLLLVVVGAERFTRRWTRRRGAGMAALVGLGLAIAGARPLHDLAGWLIAGLVAGAVLLAATVGLLRFDLSLVPVAVGSLFALRALGQAWLAPFPGAQLGGVLGAGVAILLAELWRRRLAADQGAESAVS